MDTLVKDAVYEFTVKGSRFLSELLPCDTAEKARERLKAQKEKYANATHVVHAFIVGKDGQVSGMSDDGEPGGTAGRPVLDVLSGRKCTNVMLTVTRWFGGTLLGTGGLVKAYGDAAKGVIAAADSSGAFTELVEMRAFTYTADYSTYERLRRAMAAFRLKDVTQQWGETVQVTGAVRKDEYEPFSKAINDATGGQVLVDYK